MPIDRGAVDAARPTLTRLVRVLRSGAEVEPRGVVLALSLLNDVCSPLYLASGQPPGDGSTLLREARRALLALQPTSAEPMPDSADSVLD